MSQSDRVIAETSHLRLVERDGWSYVERTKASGVVCVVARTDDHRILLVEQFRKPVGTNVIELPAGLAGDDGNPDEPLEEAAQRELVEETGHRAERLVRRAVVTSSAGLTNEVITMFVAEGLTKVGPGGGVEAENIRVHKVPLSEAGDWLAHAQTEGKLVDSRVYAGMYFLIQHTYQPQGASRD